VAWRTVVISNPARLRIRNDQLVIERQDINISLPAEDIAVLLLESSEVLMSSEVLARLAEKDVTVLACDRRHMPCFAGSAFAGHSRLAGVQRLQIETSLPFRKRCWQAIVKRKVENQAKCLEILGRSGSAKISAMADMVLSGDSTNIESVAAREHFREAFGDDFIRGAKDSVNAALNYGYAILRGVVARSLAAHGFILSQGLHHHSELNQFNLADDFLEPLRPLVDLCVAGMCLGNELTKQDRETLVSLVQADVVIDGCRYGVVRAAEMMAGSFLAACRTKDPRKLKLPTIVPITVHCYE